MSENAEEFAEKLESTLRELDRTVRSLTPNMLEYRPKAGEETMRELLGSAIKTAAVLKESTSVPELKVTEVKTPSFAGPDEGRAILLSALDGAIQNIKKMSEEDWRASLRIEGSDAWRGETRATIAESFLRDLRRLEGILRMVADTAAFSG